MLGDAFRLGVLDRRWAISDRAKSKELRGCGAADGERGVEKDDECGSGTALFEKDIERSEVGVDSSIA